MSYTYRSDIAPAQTGVNITVSDGRYCHSNLNCARAKFTAPGTVSSGSVILLAELPRGAVVYPDLTYIKGTSGGTLKAGSNALTSGAQLIESGMEEITLTTGAQITSGGVVEVGIVFGSLT